MFGRLKRHRPSLNVQGAMVSDVGTVRPHNEDRVAFRIDAAKPSGRSDRVLAIVADGMGGHAAGEVASQIAVDTCLKRFSAAPNRPAPWLTHTLLGADRAVRCAAAADARRRGMGTTIALILIQDGRLHTGHIGDCRVYRMRSGSLTQLTEDHSLVAALVANGDLSPEAARTHPQKNIVLQAIGKGEAVTPAVSPRTGHRLDAGDRILLCSDGLTDALTDKAIAACMRNVPAAQEACDVLRYQALKAGARDNVSLGIFDLSAAAQTVAAPTASPLAETGDISITGALT
ncbi:MAG: protein phosphatase 2C domain-containing protein [Pseudomonadota bacterium]